MFAPPSGARSPSKRRGSTLSSSRSSVGTSAPIFRPFPALSVRCLQKGAPSVWDAPLVAAAFLRSSLSADLRSRRAGARGGTIAAAWRHFPASRRPQQERGQADYRPRERWRPQGQSTAWSNSGHCRLPAASPSASSASGLAPWLFQAAGGRSRRVSCAECRRVPPRQGTGRHPGRSWQRAADCAHHGRFVWPHPSLGAALGCLPVSPSALAPLRSHGPCDVQARSLFTRYQHPPVLWSRLERYLRLLPYYCSRGTGLAAQAGPGCAASTPQSPPSSSPSAPPHTAASRRSWRRTKKLRSDAPYSPSSAASGSFQMPWPASSRSAPCPRRCEHRASCPGHRAGSPTWEIADWGEHPAA